MNINPYLFFDDNCREAFAFYSQCLGVEPKAMLSARDAMGDDVPPGGNPDLIMHACIEIHGHRLMGSDWHCGPSPQPYKKPAGFRVSLHFPEIEDARRAFEALAEGGTVESPFEKTFFADGFGMLTDRFGIPWMVLGGNDH